MPRLNGDFQEELWVKGFFGQEVKFGRKIDLFIKLFLRKMKIFVNICVSKTNFLSKIQMCSKDRNFCHVSKFLSKIQFFFVKDRNFCQITKFLSQNEIFIKKKRLFLKYRILFKDRFFVNDRNFFQRTKFLSNITILIENRSFW